ncbi:MAG: RES family NAD+ phosphorylase [Acidobacteriaceae bacterium]|nr:RES family NAD+ phosphorylase [Acidobacteriaceae bacterium]
MISAFRLCAAYRDPRDPTGARKRGGRWNSPGKAMLYAASSLSLACLEILVHLRDPANLPDFIYSEIKIPTDEIRFWSWPESETPLLLESENLSRDIGDRWLNGHSPALTQPNYADNSAPALQVPSVVVPQEHNILINPEHPRFLRLIWSDPKPFRIDPRLVDPSLR